MSDSQTLHWQALSRDHHLPPFTDYKALNAKGTRIITKASGVYLWDSEGHKILDAMAGLWCVNLGYGREELVEAATRQMRELPYYNLFFQTAKSEEHTSELQSLMRISYAVFCLKNKHTQKNK